MFVFPPLPPKDHVLKDIPRSLLSSQEFTPNGKIRVTLPEIGKHMIAVGVKQADLPTKVPFKEVNAAVVKTWVDRDRYNWLVKPGKEDYMIHDVFKKYNVIVCKSYDIRYLHTPPVIPRSFKYELDCLEAFRLKKLDRKIQQDEREDKRRQAQQLQKTEIVNEPLSEELQGATTPFYPRWQAQPHLFAPSQTDPCKRRTEFALVGRPFKNEACNWYYKNYPPPDIKWQPVKFS